MTADDETHLRRFVEAVAIGEIADQLCAAECRRLGIPVDVGLRSPLDSVSMKLYAGGSNAKH